MPPAKKTTAPRALLPCVALALIATFVAAEAEAGPWVRDLGSGYVKLGASRFTSSEGFNQGVSTGLQYESAAFNLYAEVGLPARLQLVVGVPYVVGRNNSAAGVNYINATFGDATFQLDYGLIKDLPLTLSLEAKVPLYTPLAQQGADGPIASFPRSAAKFPDAGDGNIDLTPKVQAGYGFEVVPAWVTAELGYRARLDGFADGIAYALSGGIFVIPDHLAVGFFGSGIFNIQKDDDPTQQATKQFTYIQAYTFVPLAPFLPEATVSLSAGTIVGAKNTAAGSDISAGVSYEF